MHVVLPHAPVFFLSFNFYLASDYLNFVLWLWGFHVISAFTVSDHQGFFFLSISQEDTYTTTPETLDVEHLKENFSLL